jgi:hypothetical protein
MPKVYTIDEDILVSEYPSHSIIRLSEALEECSKRIKLCPGPHYLLINIHGLVAFDHKAQQLFLSGQCAAHTKGVAIVHSKDTVFYEQGKVFLVLLKDYHPRTFEIEIFDKEQDALCWINSKRESEFSKFNSLAS